MVNQMLYLLRLAGQEGLIGEFLVLVLVRGVAPLLVGMIVIGRSGSTMMVELGAMRVTGQVHLLDAQGIDPFLYLVIPRVLATAIGMFCLSMVFLAVALTTGLVAANALGLTSLTLLDFFEEVLTAMGPREYGALAAQDADERFCYRADLVHHGSGHRQNRPRGVGTAARGVRQGGARHLADFWCLYYPAVGGLSDLPSGIAVRRVILVLDAAVSLSDQPGDREHVTVNMVLQAGELALIRVEPLPWALAFLDICSGLLSPAYGHVSFLNRDWAGLSPDRANTLRGRIGRVFATSTWLPHLSLLDNVVLRQLHHTHRPLAELRHEAMQLATRFGLPGLPAGGPWDFYHNLQRTACVGAFLGSPVLLLLEEPTSGVYPELLVPLIHAIRWARSRGSAVVWLTTAAAIWNDPSLPATWRFAWLAGSLGRCLD